MSMQRILGTVLFWGTFFAFIGALFGAGLGAFVPDYYRAVFRMSSERVFSPVQTGIGLGVTQGFAVGIALAIGAMGLQTWRRQLPSGADLAMPATDIATGPRLWIRWVQKPWIRWALWGVDTLILTVIFSLTAFIVGAIVGEGKLQRSLTDSKLLKVAKILESNEFPDLRPECSSAAQVYLTGSVPSEQARAILYRQLILAFGTDEANIVIRTVDIKP
jgi:hypothetical protein